MTSKTVLLLGATGTIGRATRTELLKAGYRIIAPVRDPNQVGDGTDVKLWRTRPEYALAEHDIDAVVSCVASRTGLDAWAVDYQQNSDVLHAALTHGVRQFVLLSAICVQKPRLTFQKAKLAFEAELQASGLIWSIVRPTAYFKSLSGQIDRVRAGKPFLVFGDGKLTACKPISDRDTARFLLRCLEDEGLQNRVLPIGGPGPAITPLDQGQLLFDALGQQPKFKHVPLGLLPTIAGALRPVGLLSQKVREKAELARIGNYYASESMLVWDEKRGTYDADATPEFGRDTLADHYRELVASAASADLGAHKVFGG